MKSGYIICSHSFTIDIGDNEFEFSVGDKFIFEVLDNKSIVIIKSSKGDIRFHINTIATYFETVSEHRKRIIKDII